MAHLEGLVEGHAPLVVLVESKGKGKSVPAHAETFSPFAAHLEKIASKRAGRNLPSVSYVEVSDPCLARWTCLRLIGKRGLGIHDSDVNQENDGEMIL